MPDIEGVFARLRTELRGSVPVPDLDSVAGRYRQRRTRRRMQVGAVAAVLVVSGVVPILRQLDAAPPPATPPPVTGLPGSRPIPFITDMGFADDRNGYALRALCDEPADGGQEGCELTLLATNDLEHWRKVGPVPTPERRRDGGAIGSLVVLGPEQLAVDFADTVRDDTSRRARVYSGDGGRTWRWVPTPPVVTDTVPAIPKGSQLTAACYDGIDTHLTCATPTFIVVRPGSGAPAVLATPPPLVDPRPGAIPTADGHWWTAGLTPGTHRRAIAVSTDDGRTWRTGTLDIDLPKDVWMSVVSTDGVLYAVVSGGDPLGAYGLRAILRSDDDGRTWQQTWRQTGDPEEIELMLGSVVAARDGSLRLHEVPTVYVVTDGGRTVEVDLHQQTGPVTWTRAGYITIEMESFKLSTDGLHWREYQLPVE